jgi:membrane-bound lytic murein transglycosylase B
MTLRSRVGARIRSRLLATTLATALPLSLGSLTVVLASTSDASSPTSATAATTSADTEARPPYKVAPRTTIAGTLKLATKKERHRKIKVTSAKGSHTWTASSLAEHDLPSAAMRAYKNAAHTINRQEPGCHLPWTLLAGIGRVESDHGRYGGSVLGADGVPRPAIVGVALNGKGPVAAIHDTDNGRYDGDTVWDHAVGPMQFIPSTWRTAGRDGDGDGVKNPNDIDDAALASAGYLCHGGRDLAKTAQQRAAIFSYNPSDYYVDLVSAFAHGYRTGTFVIPSPPVAPNAGDGVVHLHAHKSAAKRAKAHKRAVAKKKKAHKLARLKAARKAARAAAKRRAHHRAQQRQHQPKPKPSPKPTPKPKPKPKPQPKPQLKTADGVVAKVTGGWTVAGVKLTTADLSSIASQDWDGDGTTESMPDEFDGLAAKGASATLTYYDKPTFKVNGFSLD